MTFVCELKVPILLNNPKISMREKAAVLNDAAVEIIDRLFSDPGNPKTVAAAKNYTEQCVMFI